MFSLAVTSFTLLFAKTCFAIPAHSFRAYDAALQAREASNSSASLQVDLGYGVYEGAANVSTNINVCRGWDIPILHVKVL
jgi:hypothetical protein